MEFECVEKVQSTAPSKARKRIRNEGEWGKNKAKKARHAKGNKVIKCKHEGSVSWCQASLLTRQDIDRFMNRLYDHESKVEQDTYILLHTHVENPKRKKGEGRKIRNVTAKHFVQAEKVQIPQTFCRSVTSAA